MKTLNRNIASVTTEVEALTKKRNASDNNDDDDVPDAAGNAFGGRQSKKNKN
jgi:hypothetical protein